MKSMLLILVLLLVCTTALVAQDPLSTARDLYASAAYEDALSALERIDGGGGPDVARQIDEYRAFCLFALGRTGDAESVAETLIRRQPLAVLDTADTSPRLERMFMDVRRRLLPSLIRERFRTARSALDRRSFDAAEPPLTDARLLIAEAERLGVKDEGLGDLSVLVDGFLELIRSSAEQRTSRAADVATAETTNAPASPAAPMPAPAPAATPAASAAAVLSVYSIADEGVSPPVTIDQRLPAMPPQLHAIVRSMRKTGMLDIVIDESGRVVDATIRRSLNSAFDAQILRSAGRWRYEPALKGGVPVRYAKTILLTP